MQVSSPRSLRLVTITVEMFFTRFAMFPARGMRLVLQLPNEALLPSAWAWEAADSLRSLAAITMERRSRAPRR